MSRFLIDSAGRLRLEADGSLRVSTGDDCTCCGEGGGPEPCGDPLCRACGACEEPGGALRVFTDLGDGGYVLSNTDGCDCCEVVTGEVRFTQTSVGVSRTSDTCEENNSERLVAVQSNTVTTEDQVFDAVRGLGGGQELVYRSGVLRSVRFERVLPRSLTGTPCEPIERLTVTESTPARQQAIGTEFVQFSNGFGHNADDPAEPFGIMNNGGEDFVLDPDDFGRQIQSEGCNGNPPRTPIPWVLSHALTCDSFRFDKAAALTATRRLFGASGACSTRSFRVSARNSVRVRASASVSCDGPASDPIGNPPSYPTVRCGTESEPGPYLSAAFAQPILDRGDRVFVVRDGDRPCCVYVPDGATPEPVPGLDRAEVAGPTCDACPAPPGVYATVSCDDGSPGPLIDARLWDLLSIDPGTDGQSVPRSPVARIGTRCYTVDTSERLEGEPDGGPGGGLDGMPLAAFDDPQGSVTACDACRLRAVFSLDCLTFTPGPLVAATSLDPDRDGDHFDMEWPAGSGSVRRFLINPVPFDIRPDVYVSDWLASCGAGAVARDGNGSGAGEPMPMDAVLAL